MEAIVRREQSVVPEAPPFHIPATDCIIEFGHSIVRGKDVMVEEQDPKDASRGLAKGQPRPTWYLSRLLQSVDELGEAPDGFKKFIRTGRSEHVSNDDPHAIVGGGVVTTAATFEAYRDLATRGEPPKVVIHNDGRAGYLDKVAPDDPDMTEGQIMQDFFTKRLHSPAGAGLPEPIQELTEKGRNTEDDIRHGLDTALEHGCETVTLIGMQVRIPRSKAFLGKIMSETDKYKDLKINFIESEAIIGNIAARKGTTEQWEEVLRKYHESEGYKRTLEAEQGGIAAIKSNTYGQSLGGVGNT